MAWPESSDKNSLLGKLNIRKTELTVKKKTHKICMKDGFGLVLQITITKSCIMAQICLPTIREGVNEATA